MARSKQATPIRREPSTEYTSRLDALAGATPPEKAANRRSNGKPASSHGGEALMDAIAPNAPKDAGALQLLVAVGGIYTSFLTWGFLQERLTTTSYGPLSSPELFKYPVFLNTIQSIFAAITGYAYLRISSPGRACPPVFPRPRQLLPPLLLVALTSSLASPFGYASLAHIDYITFILAKSCKLLPVMFLHITLFQKRYPLYKYLVVLSVTLGVAVFTLHASSGKKKAKKASAANPDRNTTWGLLLLGINLLFDGLTNTTQDHIFATFQPFSGPQMMCANNIISSALTMSYLGSGPWLSQTALGNWLGLDMQAKGELFEAVGFLKRHPSVWMDVLGFAMCGAVGQIFIFYTLSTFSSLLLVTITVTRKMLTMILSVVWFGHRLGGMQWIGVGLVFGGIGAEAVIQRREKAAKQSKKAAGLPPATSKKGL